MLYEIFHPLEESLKDFLNEVQNDSYNSRNANLYKYNNLKIYMDPSKSQEPHFIVRIGISEAMFNIAAGEKIQGGLGSDERFVRRWIDKHLFLIDFDSAWKKEIKPKTVLAKTEIDEE